MASSICREALRGVPFSLASPCWSLSVCALLGLQSLINHWCFYEIALGYSIISPIINGLACVMFFLFYQLYKYLFLYVLQQPPTTDTGGLFYPKALQHIFVGLYVQQVCLCALFFLARDGSNHASAIPEGALMVVLIIITVSLCFPFRSTVSLNLFYVIYRRDTTSLSITHMIHSLLLFLWACKTVHMTLPPSNPLLRPLTVKMYPHWTMMKASPSPKTPWMLRQRRKRWAMDSRILLHRVRNGRSGSRKTSLDWQRRKSGRVGRWGCWWAMCMLRLMPRAVWMLMVGHRITSNRWVGVWFVFFGLAWLFFFLFCVFWLPGYPTFGGRKISTAFTCSLQENP